MSESGGEPDSGPKPLLVDYQDDGAYAAASLDGRSFRSGRSRRVLIPINRASAPSNEGVSVASSAFYRGEKVIRQHQTALGRTRSN
jgi:hypothetical protein